MGTSYEGFLKMRNVTGNICRENTASQFIFHNPFFKSRALLKLCKKNCTARPGSDDYTAQALCMLDN
jgi:hypothetical protein